MKTIALLFSLLFVTPALAQAPMMQQPTISPSQMALRINEAVGAMAQSAEMEKNRADQLQQRVTDLQKQLDDLKGSKPPPQAKVEPPK